MLCQQKVFFASRASTFHDIPQIGSLLAGYSQMDNMLLALRHSCCYGAGNFFPTARALIGYFEVT